MKNINKLDFFGTQIAAIQKDEHREIVEELIAMKKGNYVTYSNVHVVITCKTDDVARQAINNAAFASPDSAPIALIGRLLGKKDMTRVTGPDSMIQTIENGLDKGYRHYFYGSKPETLEALTKKLKERYPNIIIVGQHSPPFRALSAEEEEEDISNINDSKADCIWIGLGAPKQEKWMYAQVNNIKQGIMFGVGAAFDFHSGTVKRAPLWMQNYGLEWFYRLIMEPRRLWRRYFLTNTLFLVNLLRYGVMMKKNQKINIRN